MKTLSIDLASHEGHLALVENERVVIKEVSKLSDSELMPALEALFAEAGWKPGDLTHIACVIGPGGFTSIRVGVSFANALADQLKLPIAGIHGSTLALARVPSATLWIHSTRKEEVFAQGKKWKEPTLVPLKDAVDSASNQIIAGDLLDEHKQLLVGAGSTIGSPLPLREVLPELLKGLQFGTSPLVPWYGRGI